MNLPEVLTQLVTAQNQQDSVAFANCFSETAMVKDEGKSYHGKAGIQQWIAQANKKYKTLMTPLEFTQTDTTSVLKAEISGSFPGSPAMLNYYFELKDDLIQSLKTLS